MRWFVLVLCVGCGGTTSPADPTPVPCAATASGSIEAARAWRDSTSAGDCGGKGIAVVVGGYPEFQMLCCASLTDDGDWCYSDQLDATDPYLCCVPSHYVPACFTIR